MNFALRVPDYYKSEINQLKGDVSMNQFIVNAIAEKIATLKTEEYLRTRSERGSRAHGLSVLANAPDVPPIAGDE